MTGLRSTVPPKRSTAAVGWSSVVPLGGLIGEAQLKSSTPAGPRVRGRVKAAARRRAPSRRRDLERQGISAVVALVTVLEGSGPIFRTLGATIRDRRRTGLGLGLGLVKKKSDEREDGYVGGPFAC